MKRWFVLLGVVGCVGLLCASCGGEPRVAVENPVNVVLIVVDTLRPDYLSTYGAETGRTERIDALAADGIIFDNAFCHSPITGPSHASLFTSRYPCEVGVVNNTAGQVPALQPMWAEIFERAGYATGAAVGIAPVRPKWGFGRGFGEFADHLDNSFILDGSLVSDLTEGVFSDLDEPFFLWSHFADPHEPNDAHGLAEHDAEIVLNGHVIGRVSTSTSRVELLDVKLRRGDNDLVLRSPHPFMVRRLSMRDRGWVKPEMTPDKVPLEYGLEHRVTIDSWRGRRVKLVVHLSDLVGDDDAVRARYAGEVVEVDGFVGRVIDGLKQRGVYDDALIVFTSDHGEGLGCHGHGGHIETLYDCMMRVPLIIKPPRSFGLVTGGRRDDLVGLVDVLPTVMTMLGLDGGGGMRGRDLFVPATDDEPAVFMETHRPQASATLYGLRGEGHLIVFEPDADRWEFYDTVADPGQHENLFDAGDPLVQRWQERLLLELQDRARYLQPDAEAQVIDEETEEMLRSLGYL